MWHQNWTYILDVTHLSPGENMLSRRINGVFLPLFSDKSHQLRRQQARIWASGHNIVAQPRVWYQSSHLFEVRFSELCRQSSFPAFSEPWRCLSGSESLQRCFLVAGDPVQLLRGKRRLRRQTWGLRFRVEGLAFLLYNFSVLSKIQSWWDDGRSLRRKQCAPPRTLRYKHSGSSS